MMPGNLLVFADDGGGSGVSQGLITGIRIFEDAKDADSIEETTLYCEKLSDGVFKYDIDVPRFKDIMDPTGKYKVLNFAITANVEGKAKVYTNYSSANTKDPFNEKKPGTFYGELNPGNDLRPETALESKGQVRRFNASSGVAPVKIVFEPNDESIKKSEYIFCFNLHPTIAKNTTVYDSSFNELTFDRAIDVKDLNHTYTIKCSKLEKKIYFLSQGKDECSVDGSKLDTVSLKVGNSTKKLLPIDVNGKDKFEFKITTAPNSKNVYDKPVSTTYTFVLDRCLDDSGSAIDLKLTTKPAGGRITVKDVVGAEYFCDDNGIIKGLDAKQKYTYTAYLKGYKQASGELDLSGSETSKEISLEPAEPNNFEKYTGDWINFRGNENNMGVTVAKTPRKAGETKALWAKSLGTGYDNAPTPPIILDDKLYISYAKKIAVLDRKTGEIIKESKELKGKETFTLNPITYADGMLFININNGQIQALRADTLESVWVSEKIGGQTLCPITYHDGYIFAGTWNAEQSDGVYFALSTTDDDENKTDEIKKPIWKVKHKGGFYWAGSYATDKYVIFGSDDGCDEGDYRANAALYSVEPDTGRIIDKIDQIRGDLRSTIAYDPETDCIYCTTKGGLFIKVHVNSDGTFDRSTYKTVELGGMCTGTPIIYKGIAFIGSSGAQQFANFGHSYKVVDVETMEIIATDNTIPGYVQTSALLSKAYEDNGKVYVYLTYNYPPGGIYVLEYDIKDRTIKGSHLFVPEIENQQYCICSIVCDSEGTMYYKNDSGYMMAVGRVDVTDEEATEIDKEDLIISDNKIIEDTTLKLMRQGVMGSKIKWTSSNKKVIDPETGAVTLPASGRARVLLTATIEKGSAKREKVFEILVYSKAAQNQSKDLADMPEYTRGADTDANLEFKISSAEAIRALCSDSEKNDFNGITFHLTRNIKNIGSISGINCDFKGNIEGHGKKISGYKIVGKDDSKYHGFIRRASNSTIKDVIFEGDVTSTSKHGVVGGVVGYVHKDDKLVIENCSFNGNVTSNGQIADYAGGLIGSITGVDKPYTYPTVEIKNCFCSGTVKSDTVAGGIVGHTDKEALGSSITNCYNKARIEGQRTGGIVGDGANGMLVEKCYNIGQLVASKAAGGILTANGGGVVHCYSIPVENERVDGNKPEVETIETTTEGKDKLLNLLGVSFKKDTEGLNDGYPLLVWQTKDVDDNDDETGGENGGQTGGGNESGGGGAGGGGAGGGGAAAVEVSKDVNAMADNTVTDAKVVTDAAGEKKAEVVLSGVEQTKDGVTKATISASVVEEAVKKAEKAAENEKGAEAVVAIKVSGNSTTKEAIAAIPAAAVKKVADAENASLKVETAIGQVTLDSEALETVKDNTATGNVEVKIEKVSATTYEVSVTSEGSALHNFGKGKLVLEFPYSLKSGEYAEGVVVNYVKADGTKEQLVTRYDAKRKMVVAEVNHLSTFEIAYDKEKAKTAVHFSDVKDTDWFAEAVKALASAGILKGKTEAAFEPQANITRAEFVAVLARLSGEEGKYPASKAAYRDVAAGSWFAPYVAWGAATGVAKGTSGDLFTPNANISRQDMAVMIKRYADHMNITLAEKNAKINFADEKDIASYAKEAVSSMQKAGIINGVVTAAGTNFNPKANASRAEAAKMIYQLTK